MDTNCDVGSPTWIIGGKKLNQKTKSQEHSPPLEQVALGDIQT